MLPAIGSVSPLPVQGRTGVVVAAQAVSDMDDGRQIVALTIRDTAEENRSAQSQPGPPAGFGAAPDHRSTGGRAGPETIDGDGNGARTAARLPTELTTAERADIARLQQRDQQVRQEEKAHAAVAGDLAGPISYAYQRGPDGRQYAIGGSVGIQATTLSGNPAEVQRKAGRMAAAAHAATNPSAQDYAAARQAYSLSGQLTDRTAADVPKASVDATV